MKKKIKSLVVWLLVISLVLTQTIFAGFASAKTSDQNRLSGSDRYKTAVAISQKGWKVSEYAVLARGDDFADALCAGPLANKYDAPILLTMTEDLNADVLVELKRLDVKNVFIIGGAGAVSSRVESALTASGMKYERIFGDDRYETSVKVAEKLGTVSSIVLATGRDYPDALSISSIAANLGMPILLAEKDTLPLKVMQYITGKQITQTYVVGGVGVLSDTVKNAVPNPLRIGGSDRFETNTLVMRQFESKLNFRDLYVAIGDGPNGDEFADALTGAVLAGNTASPVILTGKALPDITGNYIKTKVLLGSKVTALGGEAVVPSAILDSINAYIALVPVKAAYDKAGTYGPATGTETISGNVVISVPDVILQNVIIEGDLLLTEGIGNGNATLNNVTVKGTTTVRGGGPNSVVFYDFNGVTVTVDVPDGSNVRIVSEGSTDIGALDIVIPQGAVVTLDGDFGVVNVDSSGAQVNVQNGTIDSLNIGAGGVQVGVLSGTVTSLNIEEGTEGSGVSIGTGASVTTLTASAPVDITGTGTITTANIESEGVVIEQTPTNTNVGSGLTASVGGDIVNDTPQAGPIGGGGGGDSTPTVSVTGVSVSNATTVTFSSNAAPTTVTWNGTVVKTSMTGTNPYTITVPSITKTANALVVGAVGYDAGTINYTIPVGAYGNLKVINSDIVSTVSGATTGDTILVAAGTYDIGDITIDKSVTILGSNAAINPNTGTRAAETVLKGNTMSGLSKQVKITAQNVVIKGVALDNLRIDNYNTNVAGTTNTDLLISGITIENNIFANIVGTAIYLRDGRDSPAQFSNTVNIVNNKINATTSDGDIDFNAGSGMVIMGVENLSISGNVITGLAYNGVQANRNKTISITNNIVTACAQPSLLIAQWNDGTNTISDNTFSTNSVSRAAIRLYGFKTVVPGLTYTPIFNFSGNTIKDSAYGIQIGHGSGGKDDNDITAAGYNFNTNNTFTNITKDKLVVYLSAAATADNVTEMDALFAQVYGAGNKSRAITSADPFTYVVNTLYVGAGKEFTTIQAAITSAKAGDTIYVAAGVYSVDTITIPAGVTVLGTNKNTVVIEGQNGIGKADTVVNLYGTLDNVTVKLDDTSFDNWNLKDVSVETPALYPKSNGVKMFDNSTLRNSIVTNCRNGVNTNPPWPWYNYPVMNITVTGNEIHHNRTGMQIAYGATGTISTNNIHDNETLGLLLNYSNSYTIVAYAPSVTNNTFTNNWNADFENRCDSANPVDLSTNIFSGGGAPSISVISSVPSHSSNYRATFFNGGSVTQTDTSTTDSSKARPLTANIASRLAQNVVYNSLNDKVALVVSGSSNKTYLELAGSTGVFDLGDILVKGRNMPAFSSGDTIQLKVTVRGVNSITTDLIPASYTLGTLTGTFTSGVSTIILSEEVYNSIIGNDGFTGQYTMTVPVQIDSYFSVQFEVIKNGVSTLSNVLVVKRTS